MKQITVTALAAVLCLSYQQSLSQELKSYEKKTHKEGNTIFWHGDLPVYIFISTDPGGTKDLHRLEKSNVESGVNPYFFDTEGTNKIRTRWAIDAETKEWAFPKKEIEFEIERDKVSPNSSFALSGAEKHIADGTIYYGKGLSGTFSSSDGLSGLHEINRSVNKNTFASIKAGHTEQYNNEGEHVVKFYAVDKVGNTEEPQSKIFHVDLTAPKSSYEISGPKVENVLSPKAMFTLNGEDNASGLHRIFYKFDDNKDAVYSGTISMYGLADGEHTFKYHSCDRVKNEETKKSYTFYLDKIAPKTEFELVGSQHKVGSKTYINADTKVKLTANDNKAGVEKIMFASGLNQYQEYDNEFVFSHDRGAFLKYYAIDKVENKSSVKTIPNLYVDKSVPTVNFSYGSNKFSHRDTVFITKDTKVYLYANDNQSGIREINYNLDEASSAEVFEGHLNVEKEGLHEIKYTGVNNVDMKAEDSFFFVVDNTGPEIFHHFGISPIGSQKMVDNDELINVYSSGSKMYLAATDEYVGTNHIYYSLDGSSQEYQYTKPITMGKKGIRTIKVRSTDNLGNETVIEDIKFVIQ